MWYEWNQSHVTAMLPSTLHRKAFSPSYEILIPSFLPTLAEVGLHGKAFLSLSLIPHGGPAQVSVLYPTSHGLLIVYQTLYAALSEGISSHPLLGDREYSTFPCTLHSTQDSAEHTLHAGQGLLVKYLQRSSRSYK